MYKEEQQDMCVGGIEGLKGGSTQRVSEPLRVNDELEKELTNLATHLARLHTKLEPVLTPSAVRESESLDSKAKVVFSDLAKMFQEKVYTVREISEQLDILIDRIEL